MASRALSRLPSLPGSNMDYLTVLATRSLVLFPAHASPTTLPGFLGSPTRARLSPPPVAMPLDSLVNDDAHCAWFIAKRILESTLEREHAAPHARADTRALEAEAEVLAWEQIARAKMFARALGMLFAPADRTRVDEDELADLAASHGLGISHPIVHHPLVVRHRSATPNPAERTGHGHRHYHPTHTHTRSPSRGPHVSHARSNSHTLAHTPHDTHPTGHHAIDILA